MQINQNKTIVIVTVVFIILLAIVTVLYVLACTGEDDHSLWIGKGGAVNLYSNMFVKYFAICAFVKVMQHVPYTKLYIGNAAHDIKVQIHESTFELTEKMGTLLNKVNNLL